MSERIWGGPGKESFKPGMEAKSFRTHLKARRERDGLAVSSLTEMWISTLHTKSSCFWFEKRLASWKVQPQSWHQQGTNRVGWSSLDLVMMAMQQEGSLREGAEASSGDPLGSFRWVSNLSLWGQKRCVSKKNGHIIGNAYFMKTFNGVMCNCLLFGILEQIILLRRCYYLLL